MSEGAKIWVFFILGICNCKDSRQTIVQEKKPIAKKLLYLFSKLENAQIVDTEQLFLETISSEDREMPAADLKLDNFRNQVQPQFQKLMVQE